MKVGTKLNIAFYSIIAIMIISAVLTINNINEIKERQDNAFDYRFENIMYIGDMQNNLTNQELYLHKYLLENSEVNKKALLTYADELDKNIAYIKESAQSESAIKIAEELVNYNNDFNDSLDDAIQAIEGNNSEKALAIVNGDLQEASDGLTEKANELLEGQKKSS